MFKLHNLLLILGASFLLWSSSAASSSLRFRGQAATCAFGSAYPDGCAGADKNAVFTVYSQFGTSFYTHAATSGQAWTSPHPQPFNVAAVDYPVGYNKATPLKDWLTTSIGSGATAGCSLEVPGSSTGNANNKVVTASSSLAGTTFTVGSITSGVIYPGLVLGGAGISTTWANVPVVVSGSGLVWTVTNPAGASVGPEAIYVGGPRITCSGTPTFDGWDFSTGGGAQLRFTAASGSLTVKNNKFINGLNSNFGNGFSISSIVGTTASLDVENNYFDGGNTACTLVGSYVNSVLTVASVGTCPADAQLNNGRVLGGGTLTAGAVSLASTCILSGGTGTCTLTGNSKTGGPFTLTVGSPEWKAIVWNATDANITVKYNAFVNIPGLNGSWLGTRDIIHVNYNYTDSLDLNNQSTTHTAYFATVPSSGTNVTLLDYSYNVGIYARESAGSGTTMFSILGNTGLYTGYDAATIVGNTAVNNLRLNGSNSTSSALLEILDVSAVTGAFTAKDNYVDPTGALICLANFGDYTGTAFVDDGLGGGSYDGVPGNTVTVVTVNAPRKMYVGAIFGPNALAYGAIQPYGTSGTTGTGGTGTYIIDGAPHAFPSGSAKTWDSPIVTVGGSIVTNAGNAMAVNLLDGSSINYAGVQWSQGTCTGHY